LNAYASTLTAAGRRSHFGQFRLGRDELPFAGGFEDGGTVALETGPDALERGDPRVQSRELLLDLRHDPALFGEGRDGDDNVANIFQRYVLHRSAPRTFRYMLMKQRAFEREAEERWFESFRRAANNRDCLICIRGYVVLADNGDASNSAGY
jgi:hypothetical protein